MSGYFVFEQNGETFDTRDYDITVVPADIDGAPARSYTAYPRGGGNGDILVNTGRFDNVPRSYYIIVSHDFVSTYEAICDAMLPFSGYGKLMDSWATDEFFNAYLDGDLKPILTRNEEMGKVLVTFSRKPQRWINNTDVFISLKSQTSFYNDTAYAVYPLFKFVINKDFPIERIVYDSVTHVTFQSGYMGTAWISMDYGTLDKAKDVLSISDSIYVDCELHRAYADTGEDLTWALQNGQGGNEYIPRYTTARITPYTSYGPSYAYLDALVRFQKYTI